MTVNKINSYVSTKRYGLIKPQIKNTAEREKRIPCCDPQKRTSLLNSVPFYNLYLNKSNLSFKGCPEKLQQINVTSYIDAISLYTLLKHGNYLDSHDDIYNPENKLIRKRNLSFLNKIKTDEDKQKFIEFYKYITGFPDLKKVSQRIESEFINSVKNTEAELKGNEYKCISAGYDDTCSVGKKLAIPGSDIDRAYIILQGSDNEYKDKKIVQKFSGKLWNNTDQRILSYNHDNSFPSIMTLRQVKKYLEEINSKKFNFDKEKCQKLVNSEYQNLEKAAEYNILLSDCFERKNESLNSLQDLTKDDVKNFAFFIESFRDGKEVISSLQSEKLRDDIKSYDFYKYSNAAQIRALKSAINSGREQKSKIIKRLSLQNEFDKWPIDKQYEFIKTLIKYSCDDQEDFSEYFSNDYDVKLKYEPLLGRLTKGSRDELYLPEFTPYYDGYTMKYGKNKSVNLFKGYCDEVLWIDSYFTSDIERVLEDINKIKKVNLFKNINRIQCPQPLYYISGFYPINNYTENRRQIYEMRLNDEN